MPTPAVDRRRRPYLDRVADLGSGSVRLQVAHFRRIDAPTLQSIFDDPLPRGPLGVVRPALAPFWLTADLRTTAQIRSPEASASASLFRTTTPHPSPRTNPSADSSKARHSPVADSSPTSFRNLVTEFERTVFTAEAAVSHCWSELPRSCGWFDGPPVSRSQPGDLRA